MFGIDISKENDYYVIKPEIQGADEGDAFYIHESATEEIQRQIEENEVSEEFYVRAGLKSGEQGVQFFLEFDNNVSESDVSFTAGETKFTVNSNTLFYLSGMNLSYKEPSDEEAGGFALEKIRN